MRPSTGRMFSHKPFEKQNNYAVNVIAIRSKGIWISTILRFILYILDREFVAWHADHKPLSKWHLWQNPFLYLGHTAVVEILSLWRTKMNIIKKTNLILWCHWQIKSVQCGFREHVFFYTNSCKCGCTLGSPVDALSVDTGNGVARILETRGSSGWNQASSSGNNHQTSSHALTLAWWWSHRQPPFDRHQWHHTCLPSHH